MQRRGADSAVPGVMTSTTFSRPARKNSDARKMIGLQAVKFAREEANGSQVTDRKTGDVIFRYLFR